VVRKFLVQNGLGLAVLGLFLLSLAGQAYAGFRVDAEERRAHHQQEISFTDYAKSPHFLEALSENWESEFLQMAAYVWLTAWLRQRGSAESKPLDQPDGRDHEMEPHPWAPKVVHKGGVLLKLYSHSLSLSLFALFAVSFAVHAITGAAHHNEEQRLHGQPELTVLQYMKSAQFWFESLQNWQSEFLSVLTIVLLSIWLREKGSPESKPVNAPHDVTGEEIS
jgi:hypothetical protein